jgi:hypothetical protein
MRVAVAFALLLTLSACQTPCPPSSSTAPVERRYACADGSTLQVTFTRNPEMAHVEQWGHPNVDLRAHPTGSGYRYANRGVDLRGRLGETFWSRPGAADTICRAVSA